MRNDLEIKRNIFDLCDVARVFFNSYYNGFSNDYTDKDIEEINELLNRLNYDIKNIKEEINYDR